MRPLVSSMLTLSMAIAPAATLAEEGPKTVQVQGAEVRYPTTVERDGVVLRLTGTGLRKKLFFNVYAVGSYVDASEHPQGPAGLASLDAPKRLHIVMERDVDGATMADAFREAIGKNHDLAALAAPVKQLEDYLRAAKAKDDESIVFDHIPSEGVRVQRAGQSPLLIAGLPFSRAIWDIYLGKNNIGDDVKKGLVARL